MRLEEKINCESGKRVSREIARTRLHVEEDEIGNSGKGKAGSPVFGPISPRAALDWRVYYVSTSRGGDMLE